jgi:hypothetical protein
MFDVTSRDVYRVDGIEQVDWNERAHKSLETKYTLWSMNSLHSFIYLTLRCRQGGTNP